MIDYYWDFMLESMLRRDEAKKIFGMAFGKEIFRNKTNLESNKKFFKIFIDTLSHFYAASSASLSQKRTTTNNREIAIKKLFQNSLLDHCAS